MYTNSFWDTLAGQELANKIGSIADSLQKVRRHKAFLYDNSKELYDSMNEKFEDGYRFVTVRHMGNGQLLLIMEYDAKETL